MISELRDDLAQGVRDEACRTFAAFLSEQFSIFETLEKTRNASTEEIRVILAQTAPQNRLEKIKEIRQSLKEVAAP